MFQYVFPNPFEKTNIWFDKWNSFTERYKNYYVHHKPQNYSKVSIIRPGRSRLLEFWKKDSPGRFIETFSKYPDQVV